MRKKEARHLPIIVLIAILVLAIVICYIICHFNIDPNAYQVETARDAYYVLKPSGELVVWGGNEYNLVSTLPQSLWIPFLFRTTTLTDIVCISGSSWAVLAVDSQGNCWGRGSNRFGQLQTSHRDKKNGWTLLMKDVASVSVGGLHVAAIKTDGSLWTWGRNYAGLLGIGVESDVQDVFPPQKILENVRFVYVWSDVTFAITHNNDLYAFGNTGTQLNAPMFIASNISDISHATGPYYQMLTDNSELYLYNVSAETTDLISFSTNVDSLVEGGYVKGNESWHWAQNDDHPNSIPMGYIAHAYVPEKLEITSKKVLIWHTAKHRFQYPLVLF